MNLSKSKYCNGIQCNKMLWLEKYFPEEKENVANASILENGTEVGIVAQDLFKDHVTISFNDDLNQMIEETQKKLKKKNVVVAEASFVFENNFCSVDLLKKENNEYEIYEVKSSVKVHDIYLEDIAYQYYVLQNLGYSVKKAYIVHINNQYVRNGDLDLSKLFTIVDVTDIALKKQKEVKQKIKEICEYMKQTKEPNQILGKHCKNPYPCPFFKHCTKYLPENNVFKLKLMRDDQKFKLYQKGIYTYEDLLKEDLNWKFKEQIEFELYHKDPMIKKDKIKAFLKTLSYPLYFLDFETYQQSIPKYDGIKPYMQIPFQYSLHYIEEENGQLKHKEFLAEADMDPRRSLALRLIEDIPKNVCILAYNMSFEKTVIKNLAQLYPDLQEHLMNLYDHIHDLMIPFFNRDYYTEDMHGSYSIKYVLPALFPKDPSLDYHNLNLIHNGGEAMSAYADLGKLSKNDQQKIRENLLKYCELDTYAMVKIWEKLQEIE